MLLIFEIKYDRLSLTALHTTYQISSMIIKNFKFYQKSLIIIRALKILSDFYSFQKKWL